MSGLLVRLSNLALATTIAKRARVAVDTITTPDLHSCLGKSKGLFVAPDILPGALILSGACAGVFMARRPDGNWNGPTFHLLGDVTSGLRLGEPASAIFLLAMTARGVNAFLSRNVGPRDGTRISAGTAGDKADILGFVLSEGACSSPPLGAAVVTACDGLNQAVYGRDVVLADVIIRGTPRCIFSDSLTRALSNAVSR